MLTLTDKLSQLVNCAGNDQNIYEKVIPFIYAETRIQPPAKIEDLSNWLCTTEPIAIPPTSKTQAYNATRPGGELLVRIDYSENIVERAQRKGRNVYSDVQTLNLTDIFPDEEDRDLSTDEIYDRIRDYLYDNSQYEFENLIDNDFDDWDDFETVDSHGCDLDDWSLEDLSVNDIQDWLLENYPEEEDEDEDE